MKNVVFIFMILTTLSILVSCKKSSVTVEKIVTQPTAYKIVAVNMDRSETSSSIFMFLNSGPVLVRTTLGGPCPTLPVLFISFNVVKTNNNTENTIIWETSFESQLMYYSIRISLDGLNFTEIARVDPKGAGKYLYVYKLK